MWCSKNSKIFIILCLLACVPCRAQYHPLYSQYIFNGLALNPAYAGSQDVLNLAALYRSSQLGNSIEGSPVTQTFAGDFPLQNPQVALGLLVFNDKIGIFKQTGANFVYAFRVKAGEGKLSFGLQAGFDLRREAGIDNIYLFEEGDEAFYQKAHNTFMPNVGAGIYYHTPKYFAGLSFPHFLAYATNIKDYSYKGALTLSNMMLYGGVVIQTNNKLKIRPSALLQHVFNDPLFDLNCNFIMLRDRLELGLSYRNKKTLVTMVQFKINSQLCLGYAYDHTFGMPTVNNTSHEIMLRYDLKITVKAANPLYLK